MMTRAYGSIGMTVGLLALAATGAQAQGFAGGTLAVETSALFEAGEFGHTSYSGGLQFDVGLGFGLALDLASYGFSGFGSDGSNATLHAIYGSGPWLGVDGLALGGFVGRDGFDEGDSEIYGLEVKGWLLGIETESYLARHDGEIGRVNLAGVNARYEFTPAIFAMGELGFADGEGELLRGALGGGYQIDGGPELWGELGRIKDEDDAFGGDETYLAIGAEIGFGQLSGTTFGTRSLFDVVSGI